MTSTEPPLSIYERLSNVQAALHAPKDQEGRFGKHRSAEKILEAVKPLCQQHGLTLVLSDTIVSVGERNYIKATAAVLLPADDSARQIAADAYAWEGEISRGLDASQVTGIASSYARKYALQGLFAIDDGKDADSKDFGDDKPTTKPTAPKPSVGSVELATPQQKNDIAETMRALGIDDEDMARRLKDELGVANPSKMTKTEAMTVLAKLQKAGEVAK